MANMASGLIEEVLAEAQSCLDEPSSYWEDVPRPKARELLRVLRVTGPLYYKGRVYREGEGESYRMGIEVIEGVRPAEEVRIPQWLPTRDAG